MSDKSTLSQQNEQTCKGGVCLAEYAVKARQDGLDSSLSSSEQEVSHTAQRQLRQVEENKVKEVLSLTWS